MLGETIKISCVLHDRIANLTALPVAKDELHFFIPRDSDLPKNLESFVHLYSLRNNWNQERWILDVSSSKSIYDSIKYLQDMKLDLDDDLFLLMYNNDKQSSVNIWEYYEIHSSLSRKVTFLGDWNSADGLDMTKIDKWTRRTNLEVCMHNF